MISIQRILNLFPNKQIPHHFLVTASAWLSRVVTTLASLYSVRLLIEGLGVEYYSVYALLLGTAAWYSLVDMGYGQSVQNHVSESRVTYRLYDEYIIITFFVTAVLMLVTFCMLFIFGPALATVVLKQFGFLTDNQKSKYFILMGLIAIGMSMSMVVYKIWYAEQKGHLSNILPALAALFGLAAIKWISISNLEGKMFWYIVGGNAPLMLIPFWAYILRVYRSAQVRPTLTLEVFRKLSKRAMGFWLFNITAAGILQLDYIILSQFVRADDIVVYNISLKSFTLIGFVFSAMLQSFWPVSAESIKKKKWNTIKSFTIRYVFFSVSLVLVFTVGVIIYRADISELFAPRKGIEIPTLFIVLLGLAYVIRAWTDVFAVILQSMSDLGTLLKWAIIQAIINISFQLILAPLWGIYGVVFAMTISFVLTVSWALPRRVFMHMHSMD